MKINIAVPGFPVILTGGYKVMFEYANALSERGHDVMVYFVMALPYSQPHRPAWYLYLKSLWFKHQRPKWFKLHDGIATRSIYKLKDSALRRADVFFYTQCLVSLAAKGLTPKHSGVKVNLIQDIEEWILPSSELLKASWHVAATNIVIADYMVDILKQAGCTEPHIVHNWIDHAKFRVTNPISNRKRGSVAMLYHPLPKKGFQYGLNALRRCKALFPALTVELFGIYPIPGFEESWIHYTQNPTDLCSLYNQASIFLTPSLNEGWGLTATEAMASGCALVATNIDGLLVFAHDEETALLAPPADEEALALRLSELLRDDEKRKKIAQTGQQYVQRFSAKAATDAVEHILCSAI